MNVRHKPYSSSGADVIFYTRKIHTGLKCSSKMYEILTLESSVYICIWPSWHQKQITMKNLGLIKEDGSVASYKHLKIASTVSAVKHVKRQLGNNQKKKGIYLKKKLILKELNSIDFTGFTMSSIMSLSHHLFIIWEINQKVTPLTFGSPSIPNDPDTASHVSPVWWPNRHHRVQTAPLTRRRTRWMEGCTLSTRRTWGKLSSWWTIWGGVLLTVYCYKGRVTLKKYIHTFFIFVSIRLFYYLFAISGMWVRNSVLTWVILSSPDLSENVSAAVKYFCLKWNFLFWL